MMYDVVIAGGGPAGSYLGYLLSKAGYRVAIFEKESFPRDKPCAGGVSPNAIKLLPFDLSPIIEQKISKTYVSFKNETLFVHELKGAFGMTVNRSAFDKLLIEHAVNSGAVLHDGVRVIGHAARTEHLEVHTSKGLFKSRFLIGADGANSQFRSTVATSDKRWHTAISILARIPVDASELRRYHHAILFDFGIIKNGYGWIFPLKEQVNVGIFSPYPIRDHKKHLQGFISCYPGLRTDNLKYVAAKIPFGISRGEYQKNRLLLVGDAAGLCEPIFGEGIYNSLRSAELASECIQEYFNESWEEQYFTHRMKKVFSRYFSTTSLLSYMFYQRMNKRRLMNFVAKLPRWLFSVKLEKQEKLT